VPWGMVDGKASKLKRLRTKWRGTKLESTCLLLSKGVIGVSRSRQESERIM
jgi:hypothetical protein